MAVLHEIIRALWHQDFSALAQPGVIWGVYAVLFATLFLENGFLPASFFPGDTLLLLAGALVARGVMEPIPTVLILTAAASLGCWLSYLQGRWLGHTKRVQGWLAHLPPNYTTRAQDLFHRHGLAALVIGRFLAFVRTLLPTMAGISDLSPARFQLFNWLSGFIWVGSVMWLGYALSMIPLVKRYQDQVMSGLVILPVLMLAIGLSGVLLMLWRRKRVSI